MPTSRRTGPPPPPGRRTGSAYSRDIASVRSMATGSIRPGAVDAVPEPDDLHAPQDVGERPGRAVDVRDEEADRVGAAVDRPHPDEPVGLTHPTPRGPPPRNWSAPTSRRACSRASSPSGLTPGPRARECATRTWRHLTRSGMPPAETPAISGTSPSLAAVGEVVVVGRPIPFRENGVRREPVLHRPHHVPPTRGC